MQMSSRQLSALILWEVLLVVSGWSMDVWMSGIVVHFYMHVLSTGNSLQSVYKPCMYYTNVNKHM